MVHVACPKKQWNFPRSELKWGGGSHGSKGTRFKFLSLGSKV